MAGEETSRTREEAARALDGVERRLSAIFDASSDSSPPEGATYAEVALWDAARDGSCAPNRSGPDLSACGRDLEDEAFKTYAEVETYAYQVAGVVALMILPVLTRGLREPTTRSTKTRRAET